MLPALDGLHVLRSWAAMNVNIDGAPILGEVPGVPPDAMLQYRVTLIGNGWQLPSLDAVAITYVVLLAFGLAAAARPALPRAA
mgnify:CR=1 FL=1